MTANILERLWPYLGGIAKQNEMKTLAIGGASDHVHILISLPSTLSVAKAMQLLKGNSSKWIHETFPQLRDFQWQEGYGAFSIGVPLWTKPWPTFAIRMNITKRVRFVMNLPQSCANMDSISTKGCLHDASFVPVGTRISTTPFSQR